MSDKGNNKKDKLVIGILSIQGAFAEHEYSIIKAFEQLSNNQDVNPDVKLTVTNVKSPCDLIGLDGLIIPGGESTTMSLKLQKWKFIDALPGFIEGKKNGGAPIIWGTCAGLILLANQLEGQKKNGQISIGGLDITASRNLFGRQRESFVTSLEIHEDTLKKSLGESGSSAYEGIFIRAPGIQSVDGDAVKVLASMNNGKNSPVAVRQGNIIATTFHPELTEDHRWHAYFLKTILAQGT